MKKYISILLVTIMIILGVSACGQKNSANTTTEVKKSDDSKIKVVTTIFPEYDWVKSIVGEDNSNVELTMLLDNGVDLHSYQPTAADIMKISDGDLFIYVGGESDSWVDGALKEAVNKNMKVINLLDVLGNTVKEEEVKEGMEAEEEEEGEESEEEPEYDEHVWLSLKNAKVLCKAIADNLSECLIGCGKSENIVKSVDYDLTEMNSDMVYATVYQLMMDPDKYIGKTFKIDGLYYSGQDENTGTVYHYCVIQDALACCAQGLEFVVEDKAASDTVEYPEEETEIEIKGTFETYKESGDDTLYCRIANAEMKIK